MLYLGYLIMSLNNLGYYNLFLMTVVLGIHTVPLNYNFISTCVYTHGTTRFHACKMLKSREEIIIYTRRVRLIYTRRGMLRHDTAWYYTRRGYCFYIHRPPAEIDRNQLLGVYGYTGNCITRGMTILYFQLTLFIAGTYSNRDSKEPTTTPVRSARADLSTKWSCSITIY